MPDIAKKLTSLGFSIVATRGTAFFLQQHGIDTRTINKVTEGRPHCVDLIKNREIDLVINTVTGAKAQKDSFSIREAALQFNIPYTTTVSAAKAATNAIEVMVQKEATIKSIQEYHGI